MKTHVKRHIINNYRIEAHWLEESLHRISDIYLEEEPRKSSFLRNISGGQSDGQTDIYNYRAA